MCAQQHAFFGLKAFVFDWFWEEVKAWDTNIPLVVVADAHAYELARIVIKDGPPGINVRFVDLEGDTLASMAKRHSTRSILYRLILNPWHMTLTWGSC